MIITDIKEIYDKMEIGDGIISSNSYKNGIIEGFANCRNKGCKKYNSKFKCERKIIIKNIRICYSLGGVSSIKYLIKKEDFIKEGEFMV